MAIHSRHNLIKRLQNELPRGFPVDLDGLRAIGVSPQAAARHAKDGWLVRIGHGVYALPGDEVTAHAAVTLLQRQVQGLHIGGKSALGLHGVRHNLTAHETLVLWSEDRFVLPRWFAERYPARAVHAHLFEWPSDDLEQQTIVTPPGETRGLRVSTPERAALEMLYEVGVGESLEEARNVFVGLRNLRKDVTGRVLSCCKSVKAVRLFLTWARETKLLDVDRLREDYPLRVGSNKRWIGRLKDGAMLTLKPYG